MTVIKKWISHNQGVFLALIVMIGLLVWTYGCEPTTRSIINPDKKVTLAEIEIEIDREVTRLEAELDGIMKMAEQRRADIDRQQEIRRKLSEFALLSAEAGTVNPAGIVSLLVSVLGIGAVVDNRIKDKVIANRPLTASKT
jgi:hypothetical protein